MASSAPARLLAPTSDENRRIAAVRRYPIDTSSGHALCKIVSLAARIFGAPMASAAIVHTDRVRLIASYGTVGATETVRVPGLSASAVLQPDPYVVTDAVTDPRTVDHPLVRGDLGIRFYAAAPITTADGERLGTVNVLDTRPRRPSDDQLDALRDLAELVMEELDLRLSPVRPVAAERARRADRSARPVRARTARITPSGEPVSEPTLSVVQQIHEGGPVVLRVTGELDHHTAPQLTQALDSAPFAPDAPLVIDLGGVSYCDSTGITVLVTAYHRAEAAGCPLSLTGLSHDLTRVFRTVGLDQVFTVHSTVEDALTAPRR